MLKTKSLSNHGTASPDYIGLVNFLLKPLLDTGGTLSIDCEQINNNRRVWIRLALEGNEVGRVFGRGGRNLHAVKALLKTAATNAGQSIYLDVFDSNNYQNLAKPGETAPEKEIRKSKDRGPNSIKSPGKYRS